MNRAIVCYSFQD